MRRRRVLLSDFQKRKVGEYMDFETLGIILMVVGFVLIGIELVIPGFGLPGISGIICLIAGICFTADSIEDGITVTMIVIVILAIMLTFALTLLKHWKPPFVLEEHMETDIGFINSSDLEYLVGKEGSTSTDLRPTGKCKIDGVIFDVRSNGRFIEKGKRIRICRIHENTIIIEEID